MVIDFDRMVGIFSSIPFHMLFGFLLTSFSIVFLSYRHSIYRKQGHKHVIFNTFVHSIFFPSTFIRFVFLDCFHGIDPRRY